MFLSCLINTKINLIVGIAMGAGMAMVCKELCKKKVKLAHTNTTAQHVTED